jgi:hypothetical protein
MGYVSQFIAAFAMNPVVIAFAIFLAVSAAYGILMGIAALIAHGWHKLARKEKARG